RPLDPMTRAVLINVIYFKSAWLFEFDKDDTRQEPFFVSPAHAKTTTTMHQLAEFPYLEGDGFQAVTLPYHGPASMTILVPGAGGTLEEFEKTLCPSSLADLSSMRRRNLDLSIPRFAVRSHFGLTHQLADLGLTRPF